MEPDLTVLVPCFNEEENIASCLESVSWAPEILVVDSFSTDSTVEIARRFTGDIVQHEYVNSAAQKNWALKRIGTEWVLIVDADERVTPDLRDEILSVLRAPDCDGYRIRRANHFLGHRIRFCGWRRDRVLRLFRVSKGRYRDKAVHSEVILDGKTGTLHNPLMHYPYRSLAQSFEKIRRYSRWAADDLASAGVKPGRAKLLFKPPARFFRQYVLQGGFLDGMHGLVLCGFAAFSVFSKYAELWARNERGADGSGA